MSVISTFKTLKIDKESIAYQGSLLGGIAALATLVLLLVYDFTAENISLRHREDQLSGLTQVLPQAYYQNDLLASQYQWLLNDQNYQVFVGKDDTNKILSYAVQFQAQGFSGYITILMGLDANFTILGVRVLEHTETPGLGDKIEIARNDWITSFNGRSLQNTQEAMWAVKKDGGGFDQFTGATITPRAIVNEVYKSLVLMQSDLKQLISEELANESV
ncbi:MAG: electron transport complex subunit RsxG [Colwellia sp.]